MAMTEANHLPALGTRFALHGYTGTIRFAGQVQGTQGIWLGVEWDDPSRGKHDGAKDGVQYFSCLVPGSGSFIRPSQSISYGCTFLEALSSKYIELLHGEKQKESVVLGSSNGIIEVEAVGLDKVRSKLSNLQKLREVSLDGENIAVCDPPGSISKISPNIRGLNLSKNLIASWDMVAFIASELPKLEVLDLSLNRFARLQNSAATFTSSFANLRELRINQTLISWPEVITLVSAMSNLRYLEIGYNRLRQLQGSSVVKNNNTQSVSGATNLQTVNFDGNELEEWNDAAMSLTIFPSVERVILTANPIRTIAPPRTTPPVDFSENVKHIGLQDTLVTQWRDLDALAVWFPKLQTLHLSGTPIAQEKNYRQLAIAHLRYLTALDGTPISNKERTDCELYYLSVISKSTDLTSEGERSRAHPRWNELCLKHGPPDAAHTKSDMSVSQNTLGSKLISLQIHRLYRPPAEASPQSKFDPYTHASPPFPLKALPSMSMRNFRLKLLKTAKTQSGGILRDAAAHGEQASGLSAWLVMADGELSQIDFEDGRDLDWWGLQQDSQIFVYLK
ncbi:RNI-like protein [Schizopora paradoxa]|uniref:RNI-like protein n=1 Tax=Schizopora paradoxa TaxID=27342 RepID=A0A0H2S4N8_9AGAM|nr:RNI-like protein [Schizopora paradoxa]